jgi:hypothetical protein
MCRVHDESGHALVDDLQGPIRQRSPGHFAIILRIRDPETEKAVAGHRRQCASCWFGNAVGDAPFVLMLMQEAGNLSSQRG